MSIAIPIVWTAIAVIAIVATFIAISNYPGSDDDNDIYPPNHPGSSIY